MNKEIEIMAKTIYGEARGEYFRKNAGLKALEAVGHVIMNRSLAPSRPISSVCLQPWQFSCWNKNDPNRKVLEKVTLDEPIYRICFVVAKRIICDELEDITGGATHYYSTSLPKAPYWAKGKKPTLKIGKQLFFKI